VAADRFLVAAQIDEFDALKLAAEGDGIGILLTPPHARPDRLPACIAHAA
jgi:hypothetical protein